MKPAWRVLGAGLSMTGVMLGVFALRPVVLEQLEWRLLDWRFQLRGEQVPESPVAIVGIDAKSVEELGRWPWPRDVMGDLIDRLGASGAIAIGLDVTFSEPEEFQTRDILVRAEEALAETGRPGQALTEEIRHTLVAMDTDSALEASLENSKQVVLGYFFRTGRSDGLPGAELDEKRRTVRRARTG